MRHSHQQFLLQILLCVQLGSIFEESEGNLSYPRVTNGDAEKPPTLIEQALGLKQALKQFASVISSQIPSLPDKRLQQQRCVYGLTVRERKLLPPKNSQFTSVTIVKTYLLQYLRVCEILVNKVTHLVIKRKVLSVDVTCALKDCWRHPRTVATGIDRYFSLVFFCSTSEFVIICGAAGEPHTMFDLMVIKQ